MAPSAVPRTALQPSGPALRDAAVFGGHGERAATPTRAIITAHPNLSSRHTPIPPGPAPSQLELCFSGTYKDLAYSSALILPRGTLLPSSTASYLKSTTCNLAPPLLPDPRSLLSASNSFTRPLTSPPSPPTDAVHWHRDLRACTHPEPRSDRREGRGQEPKLDPI